MTMLHQLHVINFPRNIIELDPDSDDQDFYILGPEPIKRKPPLMFTPSQIKTTIRPNTFTAQDAGIYSNAELDQFWNRILFSKHSDSTLQLLGKALSYSFISSNTPNYDADSPQDSGNPYNTLRIGLHDKLLNLTPLFTPTWFSDAFIALFGYPCYILTQCGINFSTFLFVQATLTLIVKLYKTLSIKYNLKNNITLFSSIPHGFFNVLTARMVNDLNETQNKKPKSTRLKSKSLDNFIDTTTNLINHSTDVTSLHLSILNVLTKFNFLNLTCFRNDTTIPTKKLLHFLSLLFNILHFLIILIKTFIRMTI